MIVKNVEKKEKNLVSFVVEADPQEFESAVNSAYLKNKKNIAVPGFRKGKAPRMVIEGMYGADVFYEDAINDLAPKAFTQGVEQESLHTVGAPTLTNADVGDDKGLVMSFETAVYPEAKLGQYLNLEAERENVDITDAQVDAEMEAIRNRNSRLVTVDRPAKEGDTAVIDFEGFRDGVPFDGGKGDGFSLKLGSGQFVPGFEEQVVGMSAGEEKDLDITFPENYHADLAGAAVVFHVKVQEVKETELPELDDEFAKDVSEFDTLAEYRASVKENLTKAAEARADEGFRRNLMDKAIANMEVDIPDAMVEEQMDNMVRDFGQNVAMQGMQMEQYLSMLGTDLKTFRESSRPGALIQCKTQVLLSAIAKAEDIQISDEEVDAEYKSMAERYGVEEEVVRKAISVDSVKEELSSNRAADRIYSTGVAVAPAPKAEEAVETEAQPKKARKAAKKSADEAAGEEKPKRTRKTTKKESTEEKPAEKDETQGE